MLEILVGKCTVALGRELTFLGKKIEISTTHINLPACDRWDTKASWGPHVFIILLGRKIDTRPLNMGRKNLFIINFY